MKILLVANDESLKSTLEEFIETNGGGLIHYKHPLKGMDNFDEVGPDVVIFNSADYPRHWKIAVTSLRERRNRKNALFILLIDGTFNVRDADEAAYLGINALMSREELVEKDFNRLLTLINRYRLKPERADGPVFHRLKEPSPFIFMDPRTLGFVSGTVEKELGNRVLFYPSEPASLESIEPGMLIRQCSMERNGEIETFDVMVKSTGEWLELEKLDGNQTRGIA